MEAKREWLAERLPEGHVFRKLNAKATAFIEYAPLESAWVPVIGDNYLYIYCLWVDGSFKGGGIGRSLMEYCLSDARQQGKSGVCMLGADKQKAWLSDQSFAAKFGFKTADTTDYGYKLLAISFDGSLPRFTDSVKMPETENRGLTVYYDMQCPFAYGHAEGLRKYCSEKGIPLSLIRVDTCEKAKSLPCVFNNWAVLYGGRLITVNLMPDPAAVEKIIRKASAEV